MMLEVLYVAAIVLFIGSVMALGGYRAYTLTKWDDRDRWGIAL